MRNVVLALTSLLLLVSSAFGITVFTTDFEAGLPAAFSGAGSVQATGGFSGLGFGSDHLRNDSAGNPAAASVLSLAGLGAHTLLNLHLDMIAWDSWDGHAGCCNPDLFNVEVDGALVFQADFRNVDGFSNPNVVVGPAVIELTPGLLADHGLNLWGDSGFRIALTGLSHSSGTATIRFFASGAGWQSGFDESWGIDNVHVETNAGGVVPEPGAWTLLGGGLMAIGSLRLRRRRR